ncbi:MAG: tetratricopeptide repeat protein [Deltaproteobacteria bacterium]|nr:tetratricopeptide repeat protein [Deltaproteobacteria bacterium]
MPQSTDSPQFFFRSCAAKITLAIAVLGCLVGGAGCSHNNPPGKAQLSDEFYQNLLVAFAARDYNRVKDGLLKINDAGIADKRTLYLGALLALIEQNQEKAVLDLKDALVLDPDYGEAHNTLGTVYLQQKQFAAAETEFLEAAGNPHYQTPEKAYHNLGNLYQLQNQQDQAASCYLKALELQPNYFPSHYELSQLYAASGKLELAAQESEKARQLSPEHPGVWLQIGKIEAARNNPDAAAAAFKEVMKLQPEGFFADQATVELKRLPESR